MMDGLIVRSYLAAEPDDGIVFLVQLWFKISVKRCIMYRSLSDTFENVFQGC